MKHSPIALFVYNRPDHTRKTVESLKKNTLASQSELFIFSDAAKTQKQSDSVNQVREFINEIKGFKKVTVVKRDSNWGLAKSIIDGVDRLADTHGKVIVLEDDLQLSPNFLTYMNDALIRYENNAQVMQISGHMFDVEIDCDYDAVFLPFVTSWGWATWANRWDLLDKQCKGYEKLKRNHNAVKKFNLENSYPYFAMLEAQMTGEIDSWAIRWNLTVFQNNGLVLYPSKTMVHNIGFDGSGVHCGLDSKAQPIISNSVITVFPTENKVIPSVKKMVFNYLKNNNNRTLFARLLQNAKQTLRRLKKIYEK